MLTYSQTVQFKPTAKASFKKIYSLKSGFNFYLKKRLSNNYHALGLPLYSRLLIKNKLSFREIEKT